MAQDTLLGFPAHTLPYRRGEFSTLSTDSAHRYAVCFLHTLRLPRKIRYTVGRRKKAKRCALHSASSGWSGYYR